MAAITTERTPVQGCTVERLGAMRYQPMAAPAFAARWFPDGLTAAALPRRPLVVFDAKDRMQHRRAATPRVSRAIRRSTSCPRRPSTSRPSAWGIGWGMVPDLQRAGWTVEDAVVLSRDRRRRTSRTWPCSGSSGRCGRPASSRSPRRSGPRRPRPSAAAWRIDEVDTPFVGPGMTTAGASRRVCTARSVE